MSKEYDNLRRKFRERIAEQITPSVYTTVKAVDETARTCDVEIGGILRKGVLLYAVEQGALRGLVVLPKVDSKVLVSVVSETRSYVSMFSEINKILLTIGDNVAVTVDGEELTYKNNNVALRITGDRVELNADEITFNGGYNKGLVKIQELTDKINALVDIFNEHTHTLASGSVAVSGSPTSQSNPAPIAVPAINAKAQKLNKSDYENDKIRH